MMSRIQITKKTKERWVLGTALVFFAGLLGFLAGAGGSWLILAALAAGAILLVLTRSPFAGLLLVLFFLPLERIGSYESSIGTIRASQVIALITLVVWGVRALLARRQLRPNPLFFPLALFCLVSFLGVFRAPNETRAMTVFILTLFTIAVGMLLPQIVTTRQQLRRVVYVLLISATLVSIFGIFQFLGDMVGLPTTMTGLRELYTKEVFGFPRIQSTALEPLYFANYLLLPIGILYALILYRKAAFPRWVMFGLFALFLANLFLTISRGGYLGAVVLLLVMSAFAIRDVFQIRTLLPMFLGVVLVVLVVFKALSLNDATGMNLETFTSHIQNVFYGASYNERIETFDQARQAFWSSPLVGIGPGSFGPFVAQSPFVEPAGGWRIVNNELLELFAETGVLGATLMLLSLLVLLVRTIKAFRLALNSRTRYVLLGLFGAFVGVIVQYQTFSVLYIMHVWVLIGLLIAAQNLILVGEQT